MAAVDPSALQVMHMSSELATMHALVRRQRRLLLAPPFIFLDLSKRRSECLVISGCK